MKHNTPLPTPRTTGGDAAQGELIRVRLHDLVLDDAFQIRPELDETTARRYADAMRSGVTFPPVTVATINRAPVLVDGWHRVRATQLVGLDELPARLISAEPNELLWLAAAANMAHGLPLSRSAGREIFRAYVRAGRYRNPKGRPKSSREIAADLQGTRSHQTIINWMRQDFPEVFQEMRGEESPTPRRAATEALSPEETMAQTALDHLNAARRAMQGVSDPVRRGELIDEAERIVAEMRVSGPWEPVNETDDPGF
ncbi:MAG: ParB/RepB/Spo0J family partition protein [Pseudolabrys sp.]|nr:ParB/RepB/Spo0J family partition protein [Pseudolabrys sp.]